MSWIWAKIIAGIIFVLIPGFTLKENFNKHPFLTILSLLLGVFLLFLSIKPLVEASNELNYVDPIKKEIVEIRADIADAFILLNGKTVGMIDSEMKARFEADIGNHQIEVNKISEDGLWHYYIIKDIYVGKESHLIINLKLNKKATEKKKSFEKEERKILSLKQKIWSKAKESDKSFKKIIFFLKYYKSLSKLNRSIDFSEACVHSKSEVAKLVSKEYKNLEKEVNSFGREAFDNTQNNMQTNFNDLVSSIEEARGYIRSNKINIPDSSFLGGLHKDLPSWMSRYFKKDKVSSEDLIDEDIKIFFKKYPALNSNNWKTDNFFENCQKVSSYSIEWLGEYNKLLLKMHELQLHLKAMD